MLYFGFIISSIFFISVVLLLIFYLFLCFKRKTRFANNLILLIFLHSLVAIAVESWGLVIMNNGYDIIFSLKVDYTIILYFAIPMFVFVEIEDFILRKSIIKSEYKAYNFFRYLLPTLTMILATVGFGIYLFSAHYFVFLLK